MTEDYCRMTLVEAAQAIIKKKVSSFDVTRACLSRLERFQSELNCFLTSEPEHALDEARAADAALARGDVCGPLHGVPLAHKDVFHRKGMATTRGSRLFSSDIADDTSSALVRLLRAGAISLGTLNMSQLCYNPYGFNDEYGRCRNPWNVDRISGGSSSGSAAAVAAGIIFGALGSDTGGSIRLPAAMCGVVGLLPTRGRVSVQGLVPLAFSLDNVGPIARNVRDCGRLLGVIAGRDPLDRSSSDAPVPDYEAELFGRSIGRRIGVAPAMYDGMSAEIVQALEDSLDVYRSLGCTITNMEIQDFDELNALADVMELSEVASIYETTYREHKDKIHPILRDRIEIGRCIPAADYLEARDLRDQKAKGFINHIFDVVEVMLLPVMPTAAPKAADISSQLTENPDASMELVGRMTQFANYLGVPALTVPCGFSLDHLPIAFQLVGPPFSESLLFQIGHAFESVTEHHLHALDAAPLDLL